MSYPLLGQYDNHQPDVKKGIRELKVNILAKQSINKSILYLNEKMLII